jgi:TonB-dependent starch-binding outer membrane protein SusC
VTGFPLIIQNLPVVIGNQGVELSLQTINLKTAHFSWTTSGMLTIPHNKLIRFDNPLQHFSLGAHFIGYPLNTKLLLKSGGVDPQTGLYRFIDSSGEYTSQPNFARDFTSYVKLDPTLYGSVSNRLQYKSIMLEVLIFFNRQVNTNPNLGNVNYAPGFVNNNVLVRTVDARWRYPGQKAAVQRYGTGYNTLDAYYYAETSNLEYSNAAYIRCKNIYLAFQFPTTLVKKFHMNNFTFYLKGQNLFTISPYKDYDPETGTNIAPVRLLAAGLKAGF